MIPPLVAAALTTAAAVTAQQPPRTPWGDPDLQGIWPSGQMMEVPFERPPEFGLRAELSDAEFRQRASQMQVQEQSDLEQFVAPGSGGSVNPPGHWTERGRASRRTSLITDPPDGRLPPMTDEGAKRAKTWPNGNPAGGFTDLSSFTLYERCITRGVLGSAFPNIYGSSAEILQTPGFVVIRYEMIHETRVIPLDGRPHLPGAIRSYMGDPRGHWEGATLVVETTNFNGKTGSYARNGNGNPTSEALRLVERFTRRDAGTLDYAVTVEDPRTWTRPWTVSMRLTHDPTAAVVEYACHEGNQVVSNLLRPSR